MGEEPDACWALPLESLCPKGTALAGVPWGGGALVSLPWGSLELLDPRLLPEVPWLPTRRSCTRGKSESPGHGPGLGKTGSTHSSSW